MEFNGSKMKLIMRELMINALNVNQKFNNLLISS